VPHDSKQKVNISTIYSSNAKNQRQEWYILKTSMTMTQTCINE